MSELRKLLETCDRKDKKNKSVVISESLFSMEGTTPPLKEIIRICDHFGAKLLIDEAHAIGILGVESKGLCYGEANPGGIISGTFGKAFGSSGAFLACDSIMGEHLIQTSGAFRYTTALAPPMTAAALAALKIIKANPNWGSMIQKRANHWRDKLSEKGWSRPPGVGQILSLVIGSDKQALQSQKKLEEAGLLSMAIRPPTIPEGTSRLRLIIRKDLPDGTLTKLLKNL